jgi:hypothetical protein
MEHLDRAEHVLVGFLQGRRPLQKCHLIAGDTMPTPPVAEWDPEKQSDSCPGCYSISQPKHFAAPGRCRLIPARAVSLDGCRRHRHRSYGKRNNRYEMEGQVTHQARDPTPSDMSNRHHNAPRIHDESLFRLSVEFLSFGPNLRLDGTASDPSATTPEQDGSGFRRSTSTHL